MLAAKSCKCQFMKEINPQDEHFVLPKQKQNVICCFNRVLNVLIQDGAKWDGGL